MLLLTLKVRCTGNVPQNNSVIVDRFLAANGVVLGKTRMHELAYGVTSINPYFGPVLNPYNNSCHTGGERTLSVSLPFPIETFQLLRSHPMLACTAH